MDLVQFQETQIYDSSTHELLFTVNVPFVCQKCGGCCRVGTPHGPLAIRKIAKHLGITDEQVLELAQTDAPCGFIKLNECSIYPFRFEGCRLYPIRTLHKSYRDNMNRSECPAYLKFNRIRDMIEDGFTGVGWYREIVIGNIDQSQVLIPRKMVQVESIDDIKEDHLSNYSPPSQKHWQRIKSHLENLKLTELENKMFEILNPL